MYIMYNANKHVWIVSVCGLTPDLEYVYNWLKNVLEILLLIKQSIKSITVLYYDWSEGVD